jgi:ATP-dependent DNA helicase RecG
MREVGLDKLGGIGPKRRQALEEAGVRTAADLLRVLPRAYEDWSVITPAAALPPGKMAVARLRVMSEPALSYPRRGFSVVRVMGEDASGRCALQWFNQPYMKNAVRRGQEYLFYGRVQAWKGKVLINPVSRNANEALPGLVPVYRPIGPVTPRLLRNYVQKAFALCGTPDETLPTGWPERLGLMGYEEAVHTVHFPEDLEALKKAKERMVFEEDRKSVV